jgi:hypothetical protein
MNFIAGHVAKDGTVISSGITVAAFVGPAIRVTKRGEGTYEIAFAGGFETILGASVTQVEPSQGSTLDNAVIVSLSFVGMTVITGDNTGTHRDRAFSFIAAFS